MRKYRLLCLIVSYTVVCGFLITFIPQYRKIQPISIVKHHLDSAMKCLDLRPRHLLFSANDPAPYDFCADGHTSWEVCGAGGNFLCLPNLTARIENFSFVRDGHEYACTSLLNHILQVESQAPPSSRCLGGFYSWKRCSDGKFLCRADFLKSEGVSTSGIGQPVVLNCKDELRLSPSEFLARYRCYPEKSIERSMTMISECHSNPAITQEGNKRFWGTNFLSTTHVAKIQIVQNTVYYSFNEGAMHDRFRAVINDILKVLKECNLPDSEFFLWAHDGFSSSVLPYRTEQEELCVPLFVQEICKFFYVLLCPTNFFHDLYLPL